MKKVILVLSFLFLFGLAAEDIQVRVAVEGEHNTFKLKKDLENIAKEAAIKKYIAKLNSKTPAKLIEEACREYSNFVEGVQKVSSYTWQQIGNSHGQLSADFKVTLEADKINSWLKEKGFSQQADIELIVMEEPPSLGQINMNNVFGSGLDGNRFFLQNYTTFQRRLRDAIIKKVDTFGFDVKLLADNDLYKNFKSKDGNLVGVYFNVNKNNFDIDHDLLQAVKENNPDTLVLYYRIDALIFNPMSKSIRATVAFNFKDLNTAVTKSIGAQTFELIARGTQKDEVMDDLAYCAEAAMNSLMNAEGMAAKLNSIAMSIKNAANVPQAPIKLIINASVFDSKVRRRVMYALRKELPARKVASKIKTTNTTLVATVDNPAIKDPDMLYMEYILPILKEMKVELTDDKVFISGRTITIRN